MIMHALTSTPENTLHAEYARHELLSYGADALATREAHTHAENFFHWGKLSKIY